MLIKELNEILETQFSPWVLDLDLTVVETGDQFIRMSMKPSKRLNRVGDIVSGQALMAAADTAMVLAIFSAQGDFVPCATVDMNTSFLKPATNVEQWITAGIVRKGKTIVFARSEIVSSYDKKPVLAATGTYALPIIPPAG